MCCEGVSRVARHVMCASAVTQSAMRLGYLADSPCRQEREKKKRFVCVCVSGGRYGTEADVYGHG